ncbi:protein DOWNY MILDEW RESISTANCE 6-like [Cucurbita pepo subsp. pepo]|uniref:protein DOWNY MILDEW RESISTANCE 6-like n=1 Tax=Cucurbita pepo subsp. pepo TaxID=3664 RepID=UPI000C9D39F5|nr:protein DOWNY MILDEW RESISTANCE 6-like [Cucurbita pepo subsp. pepo]
MATFKMAFDSLPPSLSSSSSYVLPDHMRPDLQHVSHAISLPTIDLDLHDQSLLVHQVSEACQSFGFFQVINHGIPQRLCDAVLDTTTQFFHLPPEQRNQYVTTDHTKKVKIFNYYAKDVEGRKINLWSETFTLPWDPAGQEFLNHVPQNPPQYREVYGEYSREMGRLMERVLGLMSLGLGLDEGALKRSIGEKPELYSQANYYPPCPQPELTMGLGTHTDIVAIAVLLQSQEAAGLQIMKDQQWVSLLPHPNSLVVNVADQIQVLSNGRYKSVIHRAVTNRARRRLSLVMFYAPNDETVIKPIEELTDEHHPPLYKTFTYKQFMHEFRAQEGTIRRVKETFQLTNSLNT